MNGDSFADEVEEVVDYSSPKLEKVSLSQETLDQISSAVFNNDVEQLFKLLHFPGFLNSSSKLSLNRVLSGLPQQQKLQLMDKLLGEKSVPGTQIVGMLIELTTLWELNPEKFMETLEALADWDVWQPRDVAASVFSTMITECDRRENYLRRYINHDNPRFRRMVSVGIRCITKASPELFMRILDVSSPLFKDDDPYVSSNFSPPTLGERLLRHRPKETLTWLSSHPEIIEESETTILSAFTVLNDPELIPEALNYVDRYLQNEDSRVRKLSERVLQRICQLKKEQVEQWLQQRMEVPSALEHWISLSASGMIDGLDIDF